MIYEMAPNTTGYNRAMGATIAHLPAQNKAINKTGINAKGASTQESKAEASNASTNEQTTTREQESNGGVANKCKKKKTLKGELDSSNIQGSAIVIERNSVNGPGDSTAKANVAQKEVLVGSLKNKDCTVASTLSALMKSSKYLTDESKCSELQGTSTLKLTRDNLLENEKFVSDYSSFQSQVLNLARKVDGMIDDTIKVPILDAHHCVQMENVERQQNVILETMVNHSRSRQIAEATC